MTRIIVTNDDGVQAPGILALATAMRRLPNTQVEVIAPATNQSSGGHKKTLWQDIPIAETTMADGSPAISVSGSPADCIALAALGLLEWPPDIVVSGINRGSNMGQDITYSGTVTAALEAAIHGTMAVAVSLANWKEATTVEYYTEAARVAALIVEKTLTQGLPPLTILNVNVPPCARVKGIRLTRQGVRIYSDEMEREGNICRIVGPEPGGQHDNAGTDIWAVHREYVSVTPIHLDLTAHHFIADLAAWDMQVT